MQNQIWILVHTLFTLYHECTDARYTYMTRETSLFYQKRDVRRKQLLAAAHLDDARRRYLALPVDVFLLVVDPVHHVGRDGRQLRVGARRLL